MSDAKYIVTSHRAGYMPDEGPEWFADTAKECWEAIRHDHEIMQDGLDPDFLEPDELNALQVAWDTAHDAIEAMIEGDEPGAVSYDDGRALPWVYEVSVVENLTPEEINNSEPR